MKKFLLIFVIIIIAAAAALLYFRQGGKTDGAHKAAPEPQINTQATMTISSPAFAEGQPIPKKYTCDADGVNPPLQFHDVPNQAQSLVLVMDDPDAPVGTWTHWILWNIPANAAGITENSVPAGAVQGQASSGQNNYGGPCPPSGTHRYFFKLYALDGKLTIPSFSDVKALVAAMDSHIISQAQLMGTYSRN